MLHKLSHYILFHMMGWSVEISVPERKKAILCVAPHTSNFDFIIGELFCQATQRKANFLMKKSWFFFPLGQLFRLLGGIAVDRNKHTHMTDAIADTAKREEFFQIAITPESTRSKAPIWKKGFFFIALKAQIPIQLYALDFKNKKIICTKEIFPKEECFKEQMKEIMQYYKNIKGKHPEKFVIEEIEG